MFTLSWKRLGMRRRWVTFSLEENRHVPRAGAASLLHWIRIAGLPGPCFPEAEPVALSQQLMTLMCLIAILMRPLPAVGFSTCVLARSCASRTSWRSSPRWRASMLRMAPCCRGPRWQRSTMGNCSLAPSSTEPCTVSYSCPDCKWDPVWGPGATLRPAAGIRTTQKEGEDNSRAYHLLLLLEWPTNGQESEDSIQILIKIQDFSFYCIRCLTTIILIGKKFIYTNKLTSNHEALLFIFKL